MSVPFSNTYLRVPRGFGSILEGLAREVLRDQPEDIPEYAAHYFQTLLTKREESGVDPAEWAAKLEDRFYNNHAFKTTETSPANEKATEVTVSNVKAEEKGQKSSAGDHQLQEENHREKSYESQTEDESTYSEEVSQPIDFEKAENIHKEESINRFQIADIQSDEPRGTDKESDPAITVFDQVDRAANETDSNSVPDQNIPQSELESTDLLSFRGLSNVDVCAQELGAAEHEEGDKQGSAVVDKEIVDSGVEEKTEVAVPVEVFTYSALADVDVCATELGGPERTKQAATVEDVTHVAEKKENLKPKPEDIFLESSSPKSEITENTQQAAEDHTEKTKEETAESNSRKTDVSLAHGEGGLDGNVTPKEGSLVEISFEDIPEAQQISQVGEKKPEEEKEESKELTAIARGHYISDIQDHHIHKTEQIEKEANCEKEETESQLGAMHIMIEKVNTSDLNLNKRDDNDEEEKGENIISSNQPSAEAEKENEEDENNPKNENIEKISEDKFQQNEDSVGETYSNEPEFREGQMTDVFGENKEETHKEGYSERDQEINDGGAENNSSQVTQSNTSMARMGAESKTFEESAQHQLEENEKHQRILVQLQPENTVEEKGLVSKETEELTVGMTDSEVQEKRDTIHEEENVSLPHTADMTADGQQGEEKLLESEKDCAEFAGRSTKKQEECSRPQEEEDIMDIPLDDPEANRAAAKIQAGFRGHMTRKKMKPEDKTEGEERQEDRGQ